jgi:signal transduction histidine kinase
MLVDAERLPPAHTRRLAENIYRASQRIMRLLDDLTATRRGATPDRENTRLRDVIEDAWSGVSAQAEEAGVACDIRESEHVELPVIRGRIERVFSNLFTNALQAMPGGGRIRVEIRREGRDALVTVEDTGPGVPHSIRENLFQPFTSAGKSNGLGLGLALSRQSVLEHGGDLWLESSATGARFRLRLPLTVEAPQQSHATLKKSAV